MPKETRTDTEIMKELEHYRPTSWTKERPKLSGIYFMRTDGISESVVWIVEQADGLYLRSPFGCIDSQHGNIKLEYAFHDADWHGPLTQEWTH